MEEIFNKKTMILLIIIIILAIILGIIIIDKKENLSKNVVNQVSNSNQENKNDKTEIKVLATMQDELKENSTWCGTFQLVWNDMQNEVVKEDIIFTPQLDIVKNLNKQSFTENDISEDSYYKKWGLKNLELKEEIENGIKEKFNENSDILDGLDWSESGLNDDDNPDVKRYLFYAMLKKKFEFENEFKKLDKGSFAGKYENVKYFGIDENTEEIVKNQVEVLYYNSDKDFAVILNTKEFEQVILVRNPEGKTFEEIYETANEKADNFEGNRTLAEKDTLKVPDIDIDLFKQYNELENQEFVLSNGDTGEIMAAMQTIKMKLNNKGGEIKSEAALDLKMTFATNITTEDEKREFNFDDKYVIFLKESEKELPYFAANIENITLFQ